AAAVLLHGIAGALDLARAGLAAQLGHQFVELADAGGTQRMALGFETTRGVDRDPAADGEFAALGRRAAATRGDEAEVLGLDDLAHRRRVVDFGDVDVAGPDACDLV